MEREVIRIKKLNEEVIKVRLEEGLTVFLKPMKGFSAAIASFATRFGSTYRKFKINGEGEVVDVPDGVAHYLEHKLFENEDQTITFELFAKEKALANAQTSFNYTSYYFSSPGDSFLNSLKILLNYVQSPYFTDENVEKERGIIAQEIKMGEDDPELRVFYGCLRGLYEKSAVRIRIAGTVESISTIDKKVLYDCYETFYNLSNMCLVIVGNFKEEEVLSTIKKELKKTSLKEIERVVEEEPKKVKEHYSEFSMSVKNPLFSIGFKLEPAKKEELLKLEIGFEILAELLFGEGSPLYKEFYESGLVLGAQLSFEIIAGDNFFALIFSGESERPKEVLEKVCDEFKKAKQQGVDLEELDLVKKIVYKNIIEELSTPENMTEFLVDDFVERKDFGDISNLEIVSNFNIKDLEECLDRVDVINSNLTVAFPLAEKAD